MKPVDPDDHFEHHERASVSKPINGEKRSPWKPLLITIILFATLIVLYLLGTQYLVAAD